MKFPLEKLKDAVEAHGYSWNNEPILSNLNIVMVYNREGKHDWMVLAVYQDYAWKIKYWPCKVIPELVFEKTSYENRFKSIVDYSEWLLNKKFTYCLVDMDDFR
jgi:hypothetical protein